MEAEGCFDEELPETSPDQPLGHTCRWPTVAFGALALTAFVFQPSALDHFRSWQLGMDKVISRKVCAFVCGLLLIGPLQRAASQRLRPGSDNAPTSVAGANTPAVRRRAVAVVAVSPTAADSRPPSPGVEAPLAGITSLPGPGGRAAGLTHAAAKGDVSTPSGSGRHHQQGLFGTPSTATGSPGLRSSCPPSPAARPETLAAAPKHFVYDALADTRHWAVDVECVASGVRHCDRAVAQVALVRGDGVVHLNLYVRPKEPVVSYLTPLTSLTASLLEEQGISLSEALKVLRQHLPRDAIIVGHTVHIDINWLGLKEGVDFQGVIDVGQLWRVWNDQYQSYTAFGQEHLAKVLLGEDLEGGAHCAAADAAKSLRLFRLHQALAARGEEVLEAAKQELLKAPVSLSFARRHPTFEGVCMGNRKTCKCGAPSSI